MDYLKAFAISASGMAVEKTRLDVAAVNIANAHSTRSASGGRFAPLSVVSQAQPAGFGTALDAADPARLLGGARIVAVRETPVPPRLVYEPGHPDADEKGFVAYPGMNPLTEMVNVMTAMRAYEANVAALNAAKTMALKALEIGGA